MSRKKKTSEHKMSRRALLGLIPLSLLAGCFSPRSFDEAAWQAKVESASASSLYAPNQMPDGTFFNPWNPSPGHSMGELLEWRLSHSEQNGDDLEPAPLVANSGDYLADEQAPDSITWVGHSTFAVQIAGQVVVTDPFFGKSAAIVDRDIPPAFGPEKIPENAVLLISHNHYDHLDSYSLELLPKSCRVICPLGLRHYIMDFGYDDVLELNWWQGTRAEGYKLTCLPAQHWSRRFNQGYNETLWCAWMIERDGRKIFFGADSGYFIGYKEIGRKFPDIDLALLPIGASYPRWFMHYAHMNPKESLKAFRDLGAARMIPNHWGSIQLGDEPAAYPARELKALLAKDPALAAKVNFMPIGGRMML